jgi:sensor histidine kinase YesM
VLFLYLYASTLYSNCLLQRAIFIFVTICEICVVLIDNRQRQSAKNCQYEVIRLRTYYSFATGYNVDQIRIYFKGHL